MNRIIRVVLVFLALMVLPHAGLAQTGIIKAVAGTGTLDFSGDGGPATSAELGAPRGIALDGSGNLYIADVTNHRIRKVVNGVISTVAGNGTAGFSGDGGPATSAQLFSPVGVAVDAADNIYFTDGGTDTSFVQHAHIRKVTPNGVISTIAGTDIVGFNGDGGPATSAQLNNPLGISVDVSGNIYFADSGNHRIRKISGGIISTVAGNGTQGFSGDGSAATSAQLSGPLNVSVDPAGNLYISDTTNNRIRKVAGGVITTVAGNGLGGFNGDSRSATSATMLFPGQVIVDASGNLYISDNFNRRIRKVTDGVISTVVGTGTIGNSGDGGLASSAQFTISFGLTVDMAGNLYMSDSSNNRVRLVDEGLNTAQVLSADFDGDGKNDIVWQRTDGSMALWLMNGVNLTAGGSLLEPGSGWKLKQVGDFDGDGKSDIIWQHSDGTTAMWLMNGATVSGSRVLMGAGAGWTVKQIGDFDGDGKSDIVWQHLNGITALWLMNGLSLNSGASLTAALTGWSVKQVGDFDGDGKSDIVWQHTDGSTALWLMNGLNLAGSSSLVGPGTGWSVRQLGDFNGDGKSDILWQHADGSTVQWLMNGLTPSTEGDGLGPGFGWGIKQLGDFNGDGKTDIVWQHTDGTVSIWLMNGVSLISSAPLLGPGTGWSISRISDFNGDGKSDILWRNTNGSTAIWLMNGLSLSSSGGLLGAASVWSPDL